MENPYPSNDNNFFDVRVGKNIAAGLATYYIKITTSHIIPANGQLRINVPAGVGAVQTVLADTPVKMKLKYAELADGFTYEDYCGYTPAGGTKESCYVVVEPLFIQERAG